MPTTRRCVSFPAETNVKRELPHTGRRLVVPAENEDEARAHFEGVRVLSVRPVDEPVPFPSSGMPVENYGSPPDG
jgi:hypothetical protein